MGPRVGLGRWAPSRAQRAFYSLRRAKRTRGLRNLSPAIGTSWGKVRKRESAEVRGVTSFGETLRIEGAYYACLHTVAIEWDKSGGNRNRPESRDASNRKP
jgi:hypothetical protein